MLGDLLGSYLDSLSEREFDEPFIALLRAKGFYDIHFLHGPFEFGKDFIAKGLADGEEFQGALQTKAGDLSHGVWRQVRGQVDELRTNALAHPSFDASLPRRAVLVTTGRLTGGAPLAAQEYKNFLEHRGEASFEVWDRETLVEMIAASPEVGLAGAEEGPLLGLIAKIDASSIDALEIEHHTRRWITSPDTTHGLWRWGMECAVIANRLRRQDRLDLACTASLGLLRAAWASGHGGEPPDPASDAVAHHARELFRHYASEVFVHCDENLLDPTKMLETHVEWAAFVNYPVRCLRLAEILGLLGLLQTIDAKEGFPPALDIADFLARFTERQPGCAHPISDRWAAALIPLMLLLAQDHREAIEPLLTAVIKWVADRYDGDNFGLAGPTSTPKQEVDYLFGNPFEHVELHRRAETYLGSVILDLAAVLELQELYDVARDELAAVAALPSRVLTEDTRGQYLLGATDARLEIGVDPHPGQPEEPWMRAAHHGRAPKSYYLNQLGRDWDHLAVGAVLRDRHFLSTLRRFAQLAKA